MNSSPNPLTITFQNSLTSKALGELKEVCGTLEFTGDASESARFFFNQLIEHNNTQLTLYRRALEIIANPSRHPNADPVRVAENALIPLFSVARESSALQAAFNTAKEDVDNGKTKPLSSFMSKLKQRKQD